MFLRHFQIFAYLLVFFLHLYSLIVLFLCHHDKLLYYLPFLCILILVQILCKFYEMAGLLHLPLELILNYFLILNLLFLIFLNTLFPLGIFPILQILFFVFYYLCLVIFLLIYNLLLVSFLHNLQIIMVLLLLVTIPLPFLHFLPYGT